MTSPKQALSTKLKPLWLPLAALAIAGLSSLVIVCLVGESPRVLWEALQNTLFTSYGIGTSLYYATPLIFTGLSVAVAYHCGLFNIGAEGQLYAGCLGVVAIAHWFPALPVWVAIPTSITAAIVFGGAFGSLAGLCKAYRGSHEVIVTILLNFIAYALVDYFILYPFRNPETQNPETVPIPQSFRLSLLSDWFQAYGLNWLEHTAVNTSLLFALAAAALIYLFLFKTTWGFEMRAVGNNSTTARYAGISVTKNIIMAFFLSGALAGLVGLNQVSGSEYRLSQGFSPQLGFTGIAVAMLARNQPLAVFFPAFLFGAFQNASREIEFNSEKITKELSFVIQGVLIAVVATEVLWGRLFRAVRARWRRLRDHGKLRKASA